MNLSSDIFRGQERTIHVLKLELQAIVSFETWVLENKLVLLEGQTSSLHPTLSLSYMLVI